MADIVYDAEEVALVEGDTVENATCGESIVAGQAIYIDADDSLAYLIDTSDSTKPDSGDVVGIALVSGAVGQTIPYMKRQGDTVAYGVTSEVFTDGRVYVASPTPGGIMPAADLSTAEYTVIIGYAADHANLVLRPHRTGTKVG